MKNIAILGCCNSRNTFDKTVFKETDFRIGPFMFQPNFLDITQKGGLKIPCKDFFSFQSTDDPSTAYFTKRTMQMDLNKTFLTTIESNYPDYIVIDLSTVGMKNWKVKYKNRECFSCNAYSPDCYENLKKVIPIEFERVYPTDEQLKNSLNVFASYIKENWDLEKVILFRYTYPNYYLSNEKVFQYPENYWSRSQAVLIQKYVDYFYSLFDEKIKLYNDTDVKLVQALPNEKSNIPSSFHLSIDSVLLQAYNMKQFICSENYSKEIELLKIKILKQIKDNS